MIENVLNIKIEDRMEINVNVKKTPVFIVWSEDMKSNTIEASQDIYYVSIDTFMEDFKQDAQTLEEVLHMVFNFLTHTKTITESVKKVIIEKVNDWYIQNNEEVDSI